MRLFDVQGHRGACGLKPGNTLPSFEAALDAGVDSIETDIHLSLDSVPILCHEPQLHEDVCHASLSTCPRPEERPLISSLTSLQLQRCCADINVDPTVFLFQDAVATPVAAQYAEKNGLHPFCIPRLSDLFAFVESYATEMGARAGKSKEKRAKAGTVQFDLELKRVPFYPQAIGDEFKGSSPGSLERCVLKAVDEAGVANRVRVRSFDHRSVLAFRTIAPKILGGILTGETTPVAPEEMVRAAGADMYCPDYRFLDESLVSRLHAAGIRVVPYTVNHPDEWRMLLGWGVDGITTDYPDRLISFLSHTETQPR